VTRILVVDDDDNLRGGALTGWTAVPSGFSSESVSLAVEVSLAARPACLVLVRALEMGLAAECG
jgi:hypothetical protein